MVVTSHILFFISLEFHYINDATEKRSKKNNEKAAVERKKDRSRLQLLLSAVLISYLL